MFHKFYSVAVQRISVKKACLLLTAIYGFINAETFTLGYITGSKRKNGDLEYQRPGFRISGAMNLAIEEVNAGELAQLGHKLDFFVAETFGDEDTSILMTAELWKKNITAYIGPQETCIHEGRMAAAFNLPMISYVTFMYMNSSLFEFNNKMSSVANTILSSFDASGIAVNFKKCWNEPYHVTHMKNPFHELVEASFHETRIYVILGNYYEHMGLLMALDNRKLLDDGEYWVVGVDIEQYDEEQPDKYLRGLLQEHTDPSLLRAYRSYFSIVASASVNFENFTKIINEYREKPPFNFINPLAKLGGVVQIVPETAYLYDAVHLYAKSLLSALKEGWDPRDGRKMIEKLRGVHYHSAMGYMVYMDENGDAEGNYTLIALANNPEREPGLYPVGHFVGKEELSNLPKLRLTRNITWLTGVPPVAEPFCGYHGEKCYSRTGEIVGGVAGGILLILIAMVSVLYRNWRYEQELDSLLWKVNYKDIQIRGSKDEIITAETTLKSHSKPIVRTSQVSLSSNPEADFRYSTIYTRIGFYRGRMFAIKKVGKKSIEITREMKKELKMMRDLRHDNLNAFIGACTDPPNICIVVEYCSRGSLKDIIENDDMKLDNMFMASLVGDIIAGMIYLHESVMKYHGNLRTSNCLVDSRWVVKIADFGLREFKRDAEYEPDDIMQKFQSKEKKHHSIRIDDLYRSPELLRPRMSEPSIRDYQKADTYSFSIILYELHGRQGPYGPKSFTTLDIISLLRSPPTLSAPYRPPLDYLENCFDFVRDCLIECWAEDPDLRPDFKTIRNKLRPLRKGMKPNIFDNMMALMEKYANNLEALVDERTDQLTEEKKKTDALLYEMLPKYVAEQLKKGHKVEAEGFDCVTIYFSDIIGFTQMSAESTPLEVVNFLNDLYTCFDATIENYDVYKVETIGDAYMVVSGLPIRNGIQHAAEIASMSLCLLKKIKKFSIRHRPFDELQLRIGIHSGPVCAGVVGLKMPRYCLFGDTVNTASRMESTGSPLRIHCSKETKFLLDQIGGFCLEERGMVEMKGKGEHMTYWLLREEPGRKQGRHHVIDQTLVPKSSLRSKTRMSFLRCSSDTPKRLRFASSDQLDQGKEKIADSQDWSPCKGCMERSKSSSSSCPCVEKLEFGGNCFRRENALPEGYKSVAGSPRYVSKGMGRFGGITEVEATPLI